VVSKRIDLKDVTRTLPTLFKMINVTASSKELPCDGSLSFLCREVEWRGPMLHLKINVPASFNQLLRDGRMPICGRNVERRVSILRLKIDVTASFNQLLRDGRNPICGRNCSNVERCVSILRLKIDVTPRSASRRSIILCKANYFSFFLFFNFSLCAGGAVRVWARKRESTP